MASIHSFAPESPQQGSLQSTDRALIALSSIPTILLDPSLRILEASNSYLTVNNLARTQCVGSNIYGLVQAHKLPPGVWRLRHAIEAAVATQDVYATGELETSERNGIAYWSLRVVPYFLDNAPLYLVLQIINTTKEHQKQQAVFEQLDTNDTYRVLVQTVKD